MNFFRDRFFLWLFWLIVFRRILLVWLGPVPVRVPVRGRVLALVWVLPC